MTTSGRSAPSTVRASRVTVPLGAATTYTPYSPPAVSAGTGTSRLAAPFVTVPVATGVPGLAASNAVPAGTRYAETPVLSGLPSDVRFRRETWAVTDSPAVTVPRPSATTLRRAKSGLRFGWVCR
ncbi:hypothetical protein D3C74_378000 [compost metagenome]